MNQELTLEALPYPVDAAGTVELSRVSVSAVTTVITAVTSVVVSVINHQRL